MIACPVCHRESHHPVDEKTGWCSDCKRFTSKTPDEVKAAAADIEAVGDVAVASSILYRLHRYGALLEMNVDDLWPRDALHRYRLYARIGSELRVLCACPEPGGIGQAIVQLHADAQEVGRRLADEGQIGVMDVMPGGELSPTGEWIVPPFNRREA